MAKRLLAFLSISIFLAALLVAQETSEAPSEKKRPSTIKEKVKEVKENVQEYNDKKAEQEKDRPVNSLQFLGDFFTDKFPLTLDFGVEPGENGSDVFAILQYDWNVRFSSRIRFDYANEKILDDYYGGYKKNVTKNYILSLYPCIWYFGDPDIDAKDPLWSVGAGIYYSYSTADDYICRPQTAYLASADTQNYFHTLAPAFIASVKVPFKNFFVFGSELTLCPICYIHGDWKLEAKAGSNSYRYNNSGDYLSTPLVSQILWLDIFSFVRVKAIINYSHLSVDNYKYLSSWGTELSTAKYERHVVALRHGVELVLPSSNRTRKKDSHLWAGIYYEHSWNITSLDSNSSTEYKGRWVFCVGK